MSRRWRIRQVRTFLEKVRRKANVEPKHGPFQSAIDRDPRFAAAHAGLGQARVQIQQTRDTAFSDKALSRPPSRCAGSGDWRPTMLLARSVCGKGARTRLSKELQRAIALQPGNDDATQVAGSHAVQGRPAGGRSLEIKKVVELRPNFWGNHYNLGTPRTTRPDAMRTRRRPSDASSSCSPTAPAAFLMLATTYYAAGDPTQAISTFRQAIAIAPDVATYTNLGTALHSERRYPEAVVAYEEAARLLAPECTHQETKPAATCISI